jgi:hypothetical protein
MKNIHLVLRFTLITLLAAPASGIAQDKHPDAHDPELKTIRTAKLDSLKSALQTCQRDGACYISAMRFSNTEITQIAERLKALYKPDNALGRLVKKHLIPSGAYVLFQSLDEKEMLAKAWTQDAEGVNFAIGVYAEGKKPNYPAIDSISFNIHDPKDSTKYRLGYIGLLYNTAGLIVTEAADKSDFFQIPLNAALHFIEMNERDQAADYEPMEQGENKAAFDRLPTIKWASYPYTVIGIPGAGPDEPAVALSAEGMIRCRLAAIQYQKGLAPFIVTSGGKVHPYKTKYCEAAITCTSRGQSTSIEKNQIERCIRELNKAPYANGKRLTETEVEFYPKIEALQINPREPMDP